MAPKFISVTDEGENILILAVANIESIRVAYKNHVGASVGMVSGDHFFVQDGQGAILGMIGEACRERR